MGKRGGEDEYFPEEDPRLASSDDLAEWLEPLDCIIKPWQFLSSIVMFCSTIVLLTTIGFPVFGVHAISSILVAMPRDSSMKTFGMPRTVDVRGKNYRF